MKVFRKMQVLILALLILSQSSISLGLADDVAKSSPEVKTEAPAAQPAVSAAPPASSVAAAPIEPAKEEEKEVVDVDAAAVTSEASAPGNVTVDFKDADIQNVLRILSFKSGVNIVAGKDVVGTVTIRLVDVPWEKALDVVLKTYGYTYSREGSIIRVTTLDALKKEDLTTEVYVLNYSPAAEVEKTLKDILSERGKVRSDARSNSVIVTDNPTVLTSAKKVIERLDKGPAQVLINAKILEVTLGTADRVGIKWSTKVSASGPTRPTTFPFGARQQSLLSKYLPGGKEPSFEVTRTPADEFNPATTTTTITGSSDFPQGPRSLANESPGATNLQPSFPVATAADFKFGVLDFTQFSALLEAIQTNNKTKVLQEPHVMAMNNQEAKVTVGEKLGIPKFERNSTTGRMEITGYTDKDLGVTLIVMPQINNANEILMTVNPSITGLIGYDTLAADIVAPRFSTREAKTQIRIKDGQTIVIGGLIKDNSVDIVTKVPILGDLPLLGKLFKFKDKTGDKTDLLFFMTVNIITDKTPLPTGHKL